MRVPELRRPVDAHRSPASKSTAVVSCLGDWTEGGHM
jgi:hypothetical protein